MKGSEKIYHYRRDQKNDLKMENSKATGSSTISAEIVKAIGDLEMSMIYKLVQMI